MIKKIFSFINKNYVGDTDWDTITPIGKFFLLPACYVRTILINILAIVCFPITIFHMKFETEIIEIEYIVKETMFGMVSDINDFNKKQNDKT